MEKENVPCHFSLLLGNSPIEHFKHHIGCCCSNSLPWNHQLHLCLHRRHEHLHVRVWSHQVILSAPNGARPLSACSRRRSSHHSIQYHCGKRCCSLGSLRKQVSLLRSQQRNQSTHDSVTSMQFMSQIYYVHFMQLYASNIVTISLRLTVEPIF
jgi:hypothetical protein